MKGGLTIIAAVIPALMSISCGDYRSSSVENSDDRGRTIIETGHLEAINTKAFVLQRYGRYWYEMRIIGILDHGAIVEEGDSIIQLDPTEVNKLILDSESELESQIAALEKLIVEQANTTNEIISGIRNEEASFELKKIELEASRFEPEKARKIKELEFRQARITLEKQKKKLDLHQIACENDLKIEKIKIEQIRTRIKDAYDIIPQLTLRTPVAGVFQIAHNWRTGALVNVGDNIYTGNNLASIPELKWMKVDTYINETDFLKIHAGQKVNIRLDALPEVVFAGEVAYIGKLCKPREPNSRQKVFDVEVRILDTDERLKPGMTVSCEYLND